ncbi:MAG: AAA family ATPase [Euryarchaeota archaeon]|nr:AAA family ATPase [Euryarchaeota archaeon]
MVEMMVAEENKIERIPTCIEGFDELIQQGLPKGSVTLVTGTPGSGKSILALEYIIKGALECNEKGLYLSSEQVKLEIVEQASQFGWDIVKLEQEGKLRIIGLSSQELFEISKMNELKQLIQGGSYKRVVIDSISSLAIATMNPSSIMDGLRSGLHPQAFTEINKANLVALIDIVKQSGATSMLLSQKIEGMPGDTIDMISEFRADGLVVLGYIDVGNELNRTIQVKKLRKTKIDGLTHTFDFTETGIVVNIKEV